LEFKATVNTLQTLLYVKLEEASSKRNRENISVKLPEQLRKQKSSSRPRFEYIGEIEGV